MKKIIAILCAVIVAACAVIGVTNVRSSNRIKDLNGQISSLQTSLEAGEKSIASLTDDAAAKAAEIDAKAGEIETLTADVAAKAAEIEALTADAAAKAAEIETLTADVFAKAAEIETLTADAAAKAAEIETLTADAAASQAAIDGLTAQVEALNGEIAAKTAEVEQLTADLAAAQATIQTISDTISRQGQPAVVAEEERALPAVGDALNGFVVKDVRAFSLLNADLVLFEHEKTGALVMLLANEDNNRTFEITFRTPAETEMGVSHVFEHSTLDGSRKYPSKALFFNLTYQTYNTYMNAATYNMMTTYPVASLSEDQLLKYADFYTDSCFNPMVYTDESIFEEEAWRYAMDSAEDDLTITGTVYSEMQGAYTIESAASFNFNKTLFPGSTVGNSHGGNPEKIPDMKFEDIVEYHNKYYHPSNSLTCLYGNIENYAAFLELLDGYFSQYERAEITIADAGYTPIDGGDTVSAQFQYAVEAGSDTANGAIQYYGFNCGQVDQDTMNKLDLLTTLLSSDASLLMQNLKTALPSASAGCYIDFTGPETAVVFYARHINPEDAATFNETVDASLAQIAEQGFDMTDVDAIIAATQLDVLLISEGTTIGTDMIPNIAYYWASTGNLYGYMDFIAELGNFRAYAEDGTLISLLKDLIACDRRAQATTYPVAGLKEQQDAALAARLAEVKAGMTEEEINAIVEKTQAAANPEEEDASQYVAQLQAVTVDTLPEEARIYEISDTLNENGNRVINALADADGVGQTLLLLDADGLAQDQLHYFKLFTQLLGDLDTTAHTRGELASLTTRYLYDANIRVSVLDLKDETYNPYLRVSFMAMDEDMQAAYDLVHELLFDSKLDDVQRLKDRVGALKTSLKSTIVSSPYYIPLYRAFSAHNASFAYFNYVTYLDYYDFLANVEQLLETEPETVVAGLTAVRDFFNNSNGAVIGFSGSAESAANHQQVAEAFLSTLGNEAHETVEYTFSAAAHSEALVVDSAVNYNMIFASYDELNMEDYSGALDAVTALVSDSFLYPLLRDQYGAYGVMHGATDDGVYIISYRDPNVQQTFDVYSQLPELVASLADLDQDTLDGYILSSYSVYAQPAGEISGGMSAVLTTIEGRDQATVMDYMRELKAITADTVAQYADMYRLLEENGMSATAGAASAINANSERYEVVLNPFGVEDKSEAALADVNQGDWYYGAVRFAYENGMMQPVAEDLFGVDEDTSMGELADVYCTMLNVASGAEDSIALLAQYGVLTPDTTPDETLTREDLIMMGYYFCALVGVEPQDATLGEYPDAADVDPDLAGVLAWMLDNGLMAAHDGELKLAENANRADAAQLLTTLYQMIF